MAEQPLPLLRVTLEQQGESLRRELASARRTINARKVAYTKRRTGTTRAKSLQGVASSYDRTAKGLTQWMRDLVRQAATMATAAARLDTGASTAADTVLSFSRKYVREQLEQLVPENAPSLIAVRTDQMAAQDIASLRQATMQTMRKARLTGMTARQIQLELAERVTQDDAWQFVDAAGRAWNSDNYFNMLLRTTASRVNREAYNANLIDAGFDLCTIEGGGDPCPACLAWRGVVVSLTGATDGFPTYEDAISAGVFHPNCVCQTVYADELDGRIEAQRGDWNPDADPDEMSAAAAARRALGGQQVDEWTDEQTERSIEKDNARLRKLRAVLAELST